MTVDCDVHQGNGTAAIFAGDPRCLTLSIHQENNYPYPKPPSTLDINLRDGVEDGNISRNWKKGWTTRSGNFQPDLIYYVAGADPYRDDQLGGLKLSIEGLEKRDRLVFAKARAKKIPVAVMLAGGYARRVEDTIANPHQHHSRRERICEEPVRLGYSSNAAASSTAAGSPIDVGQSRFWHSAFSPSHARRPANHWNQHEGRIVGRNNHNVSGLMWHLLPRQAAVF